MVFWVFCPIIPRRFPLLLSWVTVEVTPPPTVVIPALSAVIPAQAGTQGCKQDFSNGKAFEPPCFDRNILRVALVPRLRGDDGRGERGRQWRMRGSLSFLSPPRKRGPRVTNEISQVERPLNRHALTAIS